jgi:hypothetical protein
VWYKKPLYDEFAMVVRVAFDSETFDADHQVVFDGMTDCIGGSGRWRVRLVV